MLQKLYLIFILLSIKYTFKLNKKDIKEYLLYLNFGVGERVRTSAPLTGPSSLANCPLHHLGTPTIYINKS